MSSVIIKGFGVGMISGSSSKEGTTRYAERFSRAVEHAAYRRFDRKSLSSVGVGTYLGSHSAADDDAYTQSITHALQHGVNVIDTSINYRHMCSERVVGKVIKSLVDSGQLKRDEIFISTKGGYIPYDAASGLPMDAYTRQTFFDSGLLDPEEVIGTSHSLDPKFLKHQIETSRKNLGLETIDLYYLHNPETQLLRLSREDFLGQLKAAFTALEEAVKCGQICHYGLATWNGFRVEDFDKSFLSLAEVLSVAEAVGGAEHHFRAVQVPLNLSKVEALSLRSQRLPGKPDLMTLLTAAIQLKLGVFTSAALDQGKLTRLLPPSVQTQFPRLASDSQRAVQFARSCPGVTTTLVGMKTLAHVKDILGLLEHSPAAGENFLRFYDKPVNSMR